MTKNVGSAILLIKDFVSSTKSDERFTVVFDEYAPPSQDNITEWQQVIREELQDPGYIIPQQLLDVYSYTGGFELQWTFDTNNKRLSGTCRLSSLFGIYQRDDEADTPMRDCIKIARPFDVVSETKLVVIGFDEHAKHITQMLFMDQNAKSAVPLQHTPASYCVAAADHLGIYGWQLGRQDPSSEKLLKSALGG